MDDRRIQFRVGAVVLATLIIGALLVALNGPAPQSWFPWAQGKYEVHIDLNQAPGIAPNTPVRKNGILIGRVSAVKDMDDRVIVTVRIDDDIRLFGDPIYLCQVRTSVLGDSTIDFASRRVPPGAMPLSDGATIRGQVLSNPLDMIANLQGDLAVMTNSLGRAGDEVAQLAQNLNMALGAGEGQQRFVLLMDRTIASLDNFSTTMKSVEGLFGDEEMKRTLKESLSQLPIAINDVRGTMGDARKMLQGFDDTLQGFGAVVDSAERNLRNIEGLTEPLGQNGDQIVNAVISAVESVDRLLEEVTMFTSTITNSRGSLGKLINDPELYDNVNQMVRNATTLIWRLDATAKKLRPILDDARVFTDKISREPGRLIGGAMNRGPGIK